MVRLNSNQAAAAVLLWLLFMALLPTTVVGQEPPDEVLDPELAETLLELEAAGLAPSEEEKSGWREAAGDSPGTGFWPGVPGQGSLRLRGYFFPEDPWRQDARLDLTGGPIRLRGRFSQGGQQAGLAGGTLELSEGPVHLAGGYLGLQGGFGLLLARSGRSGSLAADGRLGQPQARVSPWATWPDRRTIQGGALDLALGGWQGQAVFGRTALAGVATVGGNVVWHGRGCRLGVSGLQAGAEKGFSLWGAGAAALLDWAVESACWLPGPGAQANLSWQAVLAVNPGTGWGMQGGVAEARGGTGSPLGARPAFLSGDEGKGWALGGHWKPARTGKISLLVTDSQVRSLAGAPRLDAGRTWDAMASLRAGGNLRLDFRLRSRSTRRWTWSERYPWQPAVPEPGETRWQGQAGMELKKACQTLKGGLRWLQVNQGGGSSRRLLGYLSGAWRWGRWRGRAGYGAAWGAEIDLVSAVTPFPGLVLPRHWGSWGSETYAGVGWESGRRAVWASLSWRRPAEVGSRAGSWQGWLDCRVSW